LTLSSGKDDAGAVGGSRCKAKASRLEGTKVTTKVWNRAQDHDSEHGFGFVLLPIWYMVEMKFPDPSKFMITI
jgi:hypothetical protein